MKYDAFISYRHTPHDMEIAKRLHKALETYHIPASVQKKTGKKKINRVFRDQEELPIGSDLNDNISEALKEAEYLVVICSPETPDSYWVLKEIETFIEMHDRDHVLAVLIDGEPEESFPAPLLTDDEGNSVEPLAADVRGTTKKEENEKFNSEFLRLAAPLIGCTYDDLKQRHKERIIKRNLTIAGIAAGAIALFGTAFGIYNASTAARMKKLADEKAQLAEEKTTLAGEIYQEYRQKQINQSRFYAEKSQALLNEGYREDAILVALAALPSEEEDRPFVSEAEYALSKALYAYDNGYRYQFDRTLTHELSIKQSYLNHDESRLLSFDQNDTLYVFNTDDWTLLAKIPSSRDELGASRVFLNAEADEDYIYIGGNDGFFKYDYDGNLVSKYSNPDYYYIFCGFLNGTSKGYLSSGDYLFLVDLTSMSEIQAFEKPGDEDFYSNAVYSTDGNKLFVRNYTDENNNSFTMIDLNDNTVKEIPITNANIIRFDFSVNGNLLVLYSNGDIMSESMHSVYLALYDIEGKKLWSREIEATLNKSLPIITCLNSHFAGEGNTESEIVLSIQNKVTTLDEITGDVKGEFFMQSIATGFFLYENTPRAYVSLLDGDIYLIDTVSGQIFSSSTVYTEITISQMIPCRKENCFIVSPYMGSDLFVLSKHPCKDMTELSNMRDSSLPFAISPDGDYYILHNVISGELDFYDCGGNYLESAKKDATYGSSFKDDFFCYASGDRYYFLNPVTKEKEEHLLSDAGLSFYITNYCFSPDGNYLSVQSNSEIYVIDTNTNGIVGNCMFDITKESSIKGSILSNDGTALISDKTNNLYILKGENKEPAGGSEYRLIDGFRASLFATSSPDGKYFAVMCDDGYTRLIDIASNTVVEEIKFSGSYFCFIAFTDDSKTLVMQNDNYMVSFYDVESGEIINQMNAEYQIRRMDCDLENNVVSIYNGNELYLFNTEDYGVLAKVSGGLFYSKKTGSFIVADGIYVTDIPYKNYKKLSAMAKDFLHGLELSEEKKIRYNID